MSDTVKIPLDRPALPLALSPGDEVVVKGELYSTFDGSHIDARATSWPKDAPGGASVDVGGFLDFSGGGLRVESYDAQAHEVHARVLETPGEACSALGVASPCLPVRTLTQAQSRGLTVATWKSSLQGSLVVELPAPAIVPLAPVRSVATSPLFLGAMALVVAVVAVILGRRIAKKRAEHPRAQLQALARRVRDRAKVADVALAAPLLPALDRALDALKQRKIEAHSPEGKRIEAMLLRVEDRLSHTERKLRAEDEKVTADELLGEVDDALDAGDEALDLARATSSSSLSSRR
jgi:hypothetical protein